MSWKHVGRLGLMISAALLVGSIYRGQANMIKDNKEVINELSTQVNKQQIMISDICTRYKDMTKALEVFTSINTANKAEFIVTAYCPYDDVNGLSSDGNPSSTATGTRPAPGTFAVDPKVIPYGSHIVVIYEDGTIEYGRAEDTGGAIKGNRLDVFRWTYKEAITFGKKTATVLWYREEM